MLIGGLTDGMVFILPLRYGHICVRWYAPPNATLITHTHTIQKHSHSSVYLRRHVFFFARQIQAGASVIPDLNFPTAAATDPSLTPQDKAAIVGGCHHHNDHTGS